MAANQMTPTDEAVEALAECLSETYDMKFIWQSKADSLSLIDRLAALGWELRKKEGE